MKIKMLVSRVSAKGAENRGDIIDPPDAEAIRMIEAGQAEAVRSAEDPEKAVPKTRPEKASK